MSDSPRAAGLRTRTAVEADIDAVPAFWKEAAEGTSVGDDRAGVARLIERDPPALLLAEHGGLLAGTVIAGFDGRRCHPYRLAVRPSHRRRGVASALLAAAGERFAALGGRRADTMVPDHNGLAHRSWRAAGYARQDRRSRWVKPLPPDHAGH